MIIKHGHEVTKGEESASGSCPEGSVPCSRALWQCFEKAPASFLLPAHFPLFGTLKRVLHQAPMTPSRAPLRVWATDPSNVSFICEKRFLASAQLNNEHLRHSFCATLKSSRQPQGRSYQRPREFKEERIPSENAVANLNVHSEFSTESNEHVQECQRRIRVNKWQRRWQGC